ncbi:hypothetical protein F2Q69_00046501 [Brassica cretica]|uniref:Uncharacterized protein n=1 Tax=Brassica cretica TaxID=69181 RepID=A0A8S9Q228_BRACR|nr:hypothetical protein F2Q69_00046501 [Brassica cretica]
MCLRAKRRCLAIVTYRSRTIKSVSKLSGKKDTQSRSRALPAPIPISTSMSRESPENHGNAVSVVQITGEEIRSS